MMLSEFKSSKLYLKEQLSCKPVLGKNEFERILTFEDLKIVSCALFWLCTVVCSPNLKMQGLGFAENLQWPA
jgi:hypothetical protein